MDEPVKHFLDLEGFDRSRIAKWVIGDKYIAIQNDIGQIGVCSTLGNKIDEELFTYGNPDPSVQSHRIILNAWFNSIINYRQTYSNVVDIFDSVDFSSRGKIVMVGYFESLYEKFVNKGIDLKVFDIMKESHILTDLSDFGKAVAECDTLILTGTTIFNNTFTDIVLRTSDKCSVYLLGPSNILSSDMFKYRNIKVVFGSVFKLNDTRVFDRIKEGHGTRGFLKYLDKVYISVAESI